MYMSQDNSGQSKIRDKPSHQVATAASVSIDKKQRAKSHYYGMQYCLIIAKLIIYKPMYL